MAEEIKKRQQIILLHGQSAFTADNASTLGLAHGELVVEHGTDDVKLHTRKNGEEVALATFVSEKAVDSKVKVATDGVTAVGDRVTALENALGNAESTGNTIFDRVETLESGVADNKTAIENEVADRKQAIVDVTSAFEAADSALTATISGVETRLQAVEDDYLKAADKTELEGKITAEADRATGVENGLANRIKAVEDDYLKAADKSELEGKINGVDARTSTLEGEVDALQAVTKGYTAEGSIAADVAAAKTEVVLKDAELFLEMTTGTSEDGHVVYTLSTTGVATSSDLNALTERVETVEGQVETLIGDDVDKSVRTIANEELVKQLIPENAAEALNTLEEIAKWIQDHPGDAAAMNASIKALQEVTEGYTTKGSVKAADDALADRIKAVEDDYLKAADKTELEGKITAEADRATGVENGLANRIKAVEDDYLKAADKSELEGKINGVDTRVTAIVDAKPVYTIEVIGEHDAKVVVEKVDNKYTFNFDALVVDGGEY